MTAEFSKGAARTHWDAETDMLVFGSGAAGLMAALSASACGMKAMLCESSDLLGGTTATSGGSIWVPGAALIARNGHEEPAENVWRYLRNELGERLDEPLMRAYLESCSDALDFLEQHTDVRFQHAMNPDYHSDAPGGSAYGRNLATLPFDGRLLGKHFAMLRPPRPIYLTFGGMMVGRRDVQVLLRPYASWRALKQTLATVVPHLISRLSHPRGTRLLIGNALVGRFMLSLIKAGVPMHVNHSLLELVREDGRVTGAIVQTPAGPQAVRAHSGVVLATGGIAQDMDARRALMADFPHQHSLTFSGNKGAGIRAARAIGAELSQNVESPAYWSPASVMKNPDGTETVWIHGHMDRGKPGLIAVNAAGKRFTNEADSYHDVVMAMYRDQTVHAPSTVGTPPQAWFICDHRFIKAYGLGLIKPLYPRLQPFVDAGYLLRADSLDELARRIGVDPVGLAGSVATHNFDCIGGVDTAFGRGATAFNRFNGDPDQKPNPCMRSIENPPFYAVAVQPCTIGTTVGLSTGLNAEVLGAGGLSIPGLYACGNDMGSVMRGTYPGPGITLGPAIVFAWRAAHHMAQFKHKQTLGQKVITAPPLLAVAEQPLTF